MRRASIGPWVGALLAVLGCTQAPGTLPDRFDHVVLVSIDSLRADHLGIYGYPRDTSPTLDALGREGLVFERAYSTTSWTLPAHVALLTGLDDLSHGVTHHRRRLSPDIETLAEALAADGIQPVGFYSGPYLHPSFGVGRGFARWVDCTNAVQGGSTQVRARDHFASYRGATNPCLLREIRSWVDSGDAAERNFIFIHMWDVHYDYDPPPEYARRFDPDYRGAIDGRNFYRNPAIRADMDARDVAHLVALYDGEIRYTDDTLGEILALLRRAGLLERAAVVVVSDHGDEFFEHGKTGHQRTLYEEVLRVPLILHVPGHRPVANRVPRVVSLIDVHPTICRIFGSGCGNGRPGDDLLRFFADAAAPSRGDALAHLSLPLAQLSADARVAQEGKALRTTHGPSSTLRFFDAEAMASEREGTDRGEAAERADEALVARREAAREAGRRHRPGEAARATASPELEAQLRALGYLEDSSP